jgi:hypothetical protein
VGETWVVNASPLITLAKIGRLDLLHFTDQDLLIPAAVAEEILAGPASDPVSVALSARDLPDPVPTASRVEVVEHPVMLRYRLALEPAQRKRGHDSRPEPDAFFGCERSGLRRAQRSRFRVNGSRNRHRSAEYPGDEFLLASTTR